MDKQKLTNKIEQLITLLTKASNDIKIKFDDVSEAKQLAIQIRAEIRKAN